jgi:hypothetical protein
LLLFEVRGIFLEKGETLHDYLFFLRGESACITLFGFSELFLKVWLEPIRVTREAIGRARQLSEVLSHIFILSYQREKAVQAVHCVGIHSAFVSPEQMEEGVICSVLNEGALECIYLIA